MEQLNKGVADDVSELTVDGITVQLRRTVLSTTDDALEDALQVSVSAERSALPGIANIALLMSVGTIDVAPGLEGMSIDVSNTYLGSLESGRFYTLVSPNMLYRRARDYVVRIKALLLGDHAVEGDSWLTNLFMTSEDHAAIEYVLGMSTDNLSRIQREFRIPERVINSYIDETLSSLDTTNIPFKTALRFASPFPGIPGATTEMPCWISAYSHHGTDIVVVWLDNWETTIGLSDAPKSGVMLIPVVRWERQQGSEWNVTYTDGARLRLGFSIIRENGFPPAACILGVDSENNLKLDCPIPPASP